MTMARYQARKRWKEAATPDITGVTRDATTVSVIARDATTVSVIARDDVSDERCRHPAQSFKRQPDKHLIYA